MREYLRSECVVFRKTKEAFGGLSNMAADYSLEVNGVRILTSEALYQACRFPHLPDVQEKIINQKSPMTAKMVGKPFRKDSRPDWDMVRVRIMRWCLRVKLAQNWSNFSDLLLSTGDRPIVEDSRKDDFWGAKAIDNDCLVGMNVLGRLLMELRERLREPNFESMKAVSPPDISQFWLFGKQIGLIEGRVTHQLPLPAETKKTFIQSQIDFDGVSYSEPNNPIQPFKQDLPDNNCEISDDIFIIDKQTAEDYTERNKMPQKLISVLVSPAYTRVEPGESQTYSACGKDQYGRDYTLGEVIWSATGGSIGNDGVFVAGDDEGSFNVIASSADVTGMSTCIIGSDKTLPLFPDRIAKKRMVWIGEIPAQKWMRFYTEILSKHVSGGEIKIALNVEIIPEGGLCPQNIEETKSALRELGLPDSVDVEL